MSVPDLPNIPCWYRRLASRASPTRLFESLYASESSAFLYESLEAHGGRGRYSFLGARPRAVFQACGEDVTLRIGESVHREHGPPLEILRRIMPERSDAPPVAPFCGGAVGYMSYDTMRWCERIPENNPDDIGVPDAHFLFPEEVICFDHLEKLVHVLLYCDAGHEARFAEIKSAIERCGPDEPHELPDESQLPESAPLTSNLSREQFEAMVERAKEYILAGDIFQVVLSQRFEFPLTVAPLELYKTLRLTNPSPYMYYLKLDDLHIAGSSPEILVNLIGRKVVSRPLAGTRRRGRTQEEDEALARELLNDPKERA